MHGTNRCGFGLEMAVNRICGAFFEALLLRNAIRVEILPTFAFIEQGPD
jgi:hypothetical protein